MQSLKTRIETRKQRLAEELEIAGVDPAEIQRQTEEFDAEVYMSQSAAKIKAGFSNLTDEQFESLEEYAMTPANEKAYADDKERRKNASGNAGGGSWTPNG